MVRTAQDVIFDMSNYMSIHGGVYSQWYVGISKAPRARLFDGHRVQENRDAWIFSQAESNQSARQIEAYFVETLGTHGGLGGGDLESDFVYAYKKNGHTSP
jgi:hypothetical protein